MKNLYPGVNPQLNSYLQTPESGWESFHTVLIAIIAEFIDASRPAGYIVLVEKSLQLRHIDPNTGFPIGKPHKNRPDVLINVQRSQSLRGPSKTTVADDLSLEIAPILTLPVDTYIEDDDYEPMGIVVYHASGGRLPGEPVTRIEVLSPANKAGGSHHRTYLRNRTQTLLSGMRLVEIDLLHEIAPIIRNMPDYQEHQAKSHPYWILVTDPRPNIDEGKTEAYGIHVADPLPAIRIPLDGEDFARVNFNQVYHTLFDRWRSFSELVDYTALAERFEAYDETDQQFIMQRMAAIADQQPPNKE